MDFLIHWPPGPVVATVQCQGLQCQSLLREVTHQIRTRFFFARLNRLLLCHCLSVVLSSRFRVRHWSDTIETPFMITPSRIDGITFFLCILNGLHFKTT